MVNTYMLFWDSELFDWLKVSIWSYFDFLDQTRLLFCRQIQHFSNHSRSGGQKHHIEGSRFPHHCVCHYMGPPEEVSQDVKLFQPLHVILKQLPQYSTRFIKKKPTCNGVNIPEMFKIYSYSTLSFICIFIILINLLKKTDSQVSETYYFNPISAPWAHDQ